MDVSPLQSVLVSVGVAVLMLYGGLGKRRLAWRPQAWCRRCGRPRSGCACRR